MRRVALLTVGILAGFGVIAAVTFRPTITIQRVFEYEDIAFRNAIVDGDAELVRRLLEIDPGRAEAPIIGFSPIATAILVKESSHLIPVLIEFGVDPNGDCLLSSRTEWMPIMHFAVRSNNCGALKALVQSGGSLDVRDSKGRSVRDFAVQLRRPEMIECINSIQSAAEP